MWLHHFLPSSRPQRKVLYGCVRYRDALRVFLKHYYNDMAGSVLRSDFTLYMVLGYLLLFRLDELGFNEFRRLISAEDPTKMAHLLKYLINWERVEVGRGANDKPCVPFVCSTVSKRVSLFNRVQIGVFNLSECENIPMILHR